ncbi:MAG: flippase [Chloroflexi bacterium]|nr:flippase [Chloroflexota bacterium]
MPEDLVGPAMVAAGSVIAALAALYLTVLSGRPVAAPKLRTEAAARGRFTRNALTPLLASGFDRAVFWVFWIVALRILGPPRYGEYAFAINLLTYFGALTDFGLGTVLTRDIARRDVDLRPRFGAGLIIRLRLVALSAPLMLGLALVYRATGSVSDATVITAAILAAGLLPTALGQAYASVYGAWERMDRRGLVAAGTSALTVGLGLLLLGAGAGVIGLAIAGTASGAASLLALARPVGFDLLRTGRQGRAHRRELLTSGFPLMLNALLATAFVQLDILILQAIEGTTVVGHYSAAYKFINALNAVPAAVVLAAFPLMARAAEDPEALGRWLARTWRVLISFAVPAVVLLFAYAQPLVEVLLGNDFLPFTAQALAVLIWFLPLSYCNGTLQYVVISLDRQWWLTPAFMVTTLFNIGANLALVPVFGFLAAAATTIASEAVLLVMLAWILRRDRVLRRLLEPALRPALAAGCLALTIWLLRDLPWIPAAAAGLLIYAAVLTLTGGIRRSIFNPRGDD